MAMRQGVRYTKLGSAFRAVLSFGVERQEREVEITDESINGFGLRMENVSGLQAGQKIVLKHPKGEFGGVVKRIEPLKDGGFLVGIVTSVPH